MRSEYVVILKVEILQTYGVEVHPPAALLEQKLVTEKVGEARERTVGVAEDRGCGQDQVRVTNLGSRRDACHRLVSVEPEVVAVFQERRDAQSLHRRQRRADPQTLN